MKKKAEFIHKIRVRRPTNNIFIKIWRFFTMLYAVTSVLNHLKMGLKSFSMIYKKATSYACAPQTWPKNWVLQI